MTEIKRAPYSGFCFGVKRAIDKAEKAIESKNESKGKIYSCGKLIHNKQVTDALSKKGLVTVDSVSQVDSGETLIVRSHGEGADLFLSAKEKDVTIIDATCPYVKKIQNIVEDKFGDHTIIIVGDKNHPEVIGINGWCNNEAIIIKDINQAQEFIDAQEADSKLLIVSQTTAQKETFDSIANLISKANLNAEIVNTICDATKKRQAGCKEIAKESDVMIVIGDKSSSNTQELYEIAKKNCKKALFVENVKELSLHELAKYNKIGVAAGASTPESAIEEVIYNMNEQFEGQGMQDFMEEIEKSLRLPRNGEMVTGTIHQVTDKEIIVNLGCKKDGVIPLSEISMEGEQRLTELFNEGDEIQAKVLKTEDGDGNISLSRKKLEANEHWEEIIAAFEDGELIDVEVTRQVNGGVIATYKEVQGFIPLSQLSDKYIEDSKEYIGQKFQVRVTRVDQRRGKAVFSRKQFLAEERQKALAEIWSKVNERDIVRGTVMRFTDYGAFIDIGGVDGLLHISEISWGKLKHPKEVLKLNEQIDVMVLSMNEENGKISLGLKQTTPEPWTTIDDKYAVGDTVSGKIVQIKEYGCFIELEPGLDGLVHISEISYKRVGNINDELSIGQTVSAKILEIDRERKRISLSIKETLDPPVEETVEAESYDKITEEVTVSTEEVEDQAAAIINEEAPVETIEEDAIVKTEQEGEAESEGYKKEEEPLY